METVIYVAIGMMLTVVVVLFLRIAESRENDSSVDMDSNEKRLLAPRPQGRENIDVVRFEEDDMEMARLVQDWEGSTSGFERLYAGGSIAGLVQQIIVENDRIRQMQKRYGEDGKEGAYVGQKPEGEVKYADKPEEVKVELSNMRDYLEEMEPYNRALYDVVYDYFGWERESKSYDNIIDQQNYFNVYDSLKEMFKAKSRSEIAVYVKEKWEIFQNLKRSKEFSQDLRGEASSEDVEETVEEPKFLNGFN